MGVTRWAEKFGGVVPHVNSNVTSLPEQAELVG